MIVRGQMLDAEALAVLTGRPAATVRAHCDPVDTVRGVPLYDVDAACASLSVVEDAETVTAAEAPLRLGIPSGTVRSWACRGRIGQYSVDDHGRPLYRRVDLESARTDIDLHKQVG